MKVKVSNLDKKLTVDFTRFCCEQLDISPKNILIDGYKEDLADGILGYCIDLDQEKEIYCIAVVTKDRNLTQIYSTIAHEIVHIKQYMKDNLAKRFVKDKKDYYTSWYEKEAREKSLEILKKFVDTL